MIRLFYPGINQIRIILTLVFLQFGGLSYGQNYDDPLIQDSLQKSIDPELFSEEHPDLQVNTVPEKWKDESAVILYQEYHKGYHKATFASWFLVRNYEREKVMILDKTGQDDFSSLFYYWDETTPLSLGIRLIKKDGRKILINPKDAVEAALSDYPNGTKSTDWTLYKLAIPGLEIGDIIDRYHEYSRDYPMYTQIYIFDPYTFSLSGTYPVVKQVYHIDAEKEFYVSFRSFNEAPELNILAQGRSLHNKLRPNIKAYELVDTMREKRTDEEYYDFWTYEPFVKLQVIAASTKTIMEQSPYFTGRGNLIKQPISIQYISHKLKNTPLFALWTKESGKYSKRLIKQGVAKSALPDSIYYYLRNLYVMNLKAEPFHYYKSDPELSRISDQLFIRSFSKALKKNKIDHEVAVICRRTTQSFHRVQMNSELVMAIKIGDRFYLPFTLFSKPGEIPRIIEESEYFVTHFNMSVPLDNQAKTSRLPELSYQDHGKNSEIDVYIQSDYKTVIIKGVEILRGSMISGGLVVLDFDRYVQKNRELLDLDKRDIKKGQEYIENAARLQTVRKDYLSEESFPSLKIDKLNSFDILQTSYNPLDTALVYTYEIETQDLLFNAGSNYILNLGKLLGYQYNTTNLKKERINPVRLAFPGEQGFKVRVHLPDSLIAEGLDHFNLRIDNEVGTYSSEASQQDGILELTTAEIIRMHHAGASKWPDFLSIFQASGESNSKSIILHK